MTENQKAVLEHIERHNIGAIFVDGKHQFPVHFRASPTLADKVAPLLRQKTWTDLLGAAAFDNTLTDGNRIVRRTGADSYAVLWSFESHKEAMDALDAWRAEQQPNIPGNESEADLDRRGVRITRDQRKAARVRDLRQLDYAGLTALRAKTAKIIEHNQATYERQLANGVPVTLEMVGRNNASHWLTVQCIDEILDEAMLSAGVPCDM